MAETILERDKEREGERSVNYADDERRRRSRKSSSPEGEAHLLVVSRVAPPRHSLNYASSSRLGYDQNMGFQIPITYTLINNPGVGGLKL